MQRRASGGTMINWGFGAKVTDLHSDVTKALELTFGLTGMQTYRALRFPWRTTRFETDVQSLDFGSVAIGTHHTLPLTVRNDLATPVDLEYFATEISFGVTTPPTTIGANSTATLNVRFTPHHLGTWNATLHLRSIRDTTEVITQTVALRGEATGTASAPGIGDGGFALAPVANPTRGSTPVAFTLPRASDVSVSVLDVQGRVVDVLADGPHTAGRHEVTWRSRDRAAGLYFVRYRWPGASVVQRVVRLP